MTDILDETKLAIINLQSAITDNVHEQALVGEAIRLLADQGLEIERLRNIGRRLLYHDERGQGAGWQQAMVELERALPSETERTE